MALCGGVTWHHVGMAWCSFNPQMEDDLIRPLWLGRFPSRSLEAHDSSVMVEPVPVGVEDQDVTARHCSDLINKHANI